MTKEERQEELRQRLVPEIKWTDQRGCSAGCVRGSLGNACESMYAYFLDDLGGPQACKDKVIDNIMYQVFEKEGCL